MFGPRATCRSRWAASCPGGESAWATPPSSLDYAPSNQMMVVALGRLGMLEFDLASDADLVFIVPDEDSSEILFWTAVAERNGSIFGVPMF